MSEEMLLQADNVSVKMAAEYLKQPPQSIRYAMRYDRFNPSIGYAVPPEDGRTEWSYHIIAERLIAYKKGA